MIACLVLTAFVTRAFWISGIARSLVCDEQIRHTDAIVVDNFDPSYLVFQRAATLHKAEVGSRVLVPIETRDDPQQSSVASDIAGVMTRSAHLDDAETVPLRIVEPISLHAAYQVRTFLMKEHLRSITLVEPGFRSMRSFLVYQAVMNHSGIAVSCEPVYGPQTAENWIDTWHGIQEVLLQFLKLQYYRLYVLPRDAWTGTQE